MNRQSRHFHRGFTLLEVLVTMAMMAVILPVALRAMSSSLYAASYARHAAEASTLGQNKLNEIVMLLVTGQTDTGGGSGDFSDMGFPTYTWQSDETYDEETAVTIINVRVSWSDRGQDRSMLLSTLVADNTVTYQAPN